MNGELLEKPSLMFGFWRHHSSAHGFMVFAIVSLGCFIKEGTKAKWELTHASKASDQFHKCFSLDSHSEIDQHLDFRNLRLPHLFPPTEVMILKLWGNERNECDALERGGDWIIAEQMSFTSGYLLFSSSPYLQNGME